MRGIKTFSRLFLSEIASSTAEWLVTLGIQMILIFQLEEDILMVSILYLAALTPKLFMAPLLGRVIDRFDDKRPQILTIIRIIATLLAIALTTINYPWFFVLLAFLLNIVIAGEEPSTLGIIRNADTDKDQKEEALGLFYTMSNFMRIIGPLVASGIMYFSQGKLIFVVAALLFALSAMMSRHTYGHKSQSELDSETSTSKDLKIKDIFENKLLVFLFFTVFSFLFSVNMIDTSIGILIRTINNNAIFQSLFIAFMGVGGVIGVLVTLYLMRKMDHLKITVTCIFLFSVVMWLIPLVHQVWQLLILGFLGGSFVPGIMMTSEVKRQTLVSESQASQLAGMALSFNALGQTLGVLFSPLIVKVFGVKGVFLFCGILVFALGCWGSYFIHTHLRKEKVLDN